MKKPRIKCEVAIESILPQLKVIYLCATLDAVEELGEFGEIKSSSGRDLYRLQVDARFDFDEVVEYIKDWASND